MGSNFVPTFWFLDPGFLMFAVVVAAGFGIVHLWKKFRGM